MCDGKGEKEREMESRREREREKTMKKTNVWLERKEVWEGEIERERKREKNEENIYLILSADLFLCLIIWFVQIRGR